MVGSYWLYRFHSVLGLGKKAGVGGRWIWSKFWWNTRNAAEEIKKKKRNIWKKEDVIDSISDVKVWGKKTWCMLAREEELTNSMYFSCEREDSVQSYYFSLVHTCLAKAASSARMLQLALANFALLSLEQRTDILHKYKEEEKSFLLS